MRETGVSFSEVWEMVGLKVTDFEEIGGDEVPNSTPFRFLTDTFTGKVLCFGDVSRGHFLRNRISQFRTQLISICSSNISPHMGIDPILDDLVPIAVLLIPWDKACPCFAASLYHFTAVL